MPNGGYCVYYPSYLFFLTQCMCSFENWGMFLDVPQFKLGIQSWNMFRQIMLEWKYLMDYKAWYWNFHTKVGREHLWIQCGTHKDHFQVRPGKKRKIKPIMNNWHHLWTQKERRRRFKHGLSRCKQSCKELRLNHWCHLMLCSLWIHVTSLKQKVKSAFKPSGPSGQSLSWFP